MDEQNTYVMMERPEFHTHKKIYREKSRLADRQAGRLAFRSGTGGRRAGRG
jgi:hypothetical protein